VTELRAGSATDVGRVRTNNEDQLLVADSLFAVADGMGGHAAGEVASLTAVEALRAAFERDRSADGLANAVRHANRAVWERAGGERELRGMGTTLTAAALVDEDGQEILVIANVGDSRGYLLRDGELGQVTDDHSLPEEMVRRGEITPEDAAVHPQRHILTRVLGMEQDVDPDCFRVLPYRGDRVLLASDGLTNELTDDQISSILRRLADPDEAARELVRAAKENGGNDNITAVVVDVVDDDDRAGAASAALADEPAPPSTGRRVLDEEEEEDRDRLGRTRAVPLPRERATDDEPGPRRLTLRAVAFVIVLLVLLGGAMATIAWYARSSYYVGFDGDQVAIFQGRPGGVLWFDPTLSERTELQRDQVSDARAQEIEAGKEEPTLSAARRYVSNVRDESRSLTTLVATPPGETTTPPTVATTAPPAPPPS
jgi:protein phosphatase